MPAPATMITSPPLAQGSLATAKRAEPHTYDGIIPQLGPARPGDSAPSLLPKTGGLPGLTYYQCPIGELGNAQAEGWLEIHNAKIYRIKGPKGTVDCKLLAEGTVIAGADSASNRRELLLHKSIRTSTGLTEPNGRAPEATPDEKPAAAAKPKAEKPLDPNPLKK